MTLHTATLNGLELAWRTHGDVNAPPLLCLHGAWGQSEYWGPFAEAMSVNHYVVALDQRGHGESARATDGYGLSNFADDVCALRAHFGWERYKLVGLSLGGLVSINYAGRESQYLEALTIVDIAPAIAPAAAESMRNAPPYPDSFESLDAAVDWAKGDGLWGDSPGLRGDLALRLRESKDGLFRWRADSNFWNNRQANRAREWEALWDAFAKITCPIQLVLGGQSELVDEPTVERMLGLQPTMRRDVVTDAGHSVPRDEPQAFNAVARDFLCS
jgi:pimeloyl-ACP methyl ester carboxylesterase